MAKVVIDSTNAESSGGYTPYDGPVPPSGLYRVRLGYAKYGKASTGNMMLTVVLEFDTDNEKKKLFNGYGLWHNMVQLPQTLWRTKEFLNAIGQPTKLALDYDETTGKVTRIGNARVDKVWLLAKCSDDNSSGERKLKVDALSALPKQPDMPEDEPDDEVPDNFDGHEDDALGGGGYSDEPPF
jgi:hypothetical protein